MRILPDIECDYGYNHRWYTMAIYFTTLTSIYAAGMHYNIFINNVVHQPAGWRLDLASAFLSAVKFFSCVMTSRQVCGFS